MSTQGFTLSAAALSVTLLGAVPLLQGCATQTTFRGPVETADRRPFYLSGPKQKLLIEPGSMKLLATQKSLFSPARIEIEVPAGNMGIELHRGELMDNRLSIMGVTHGLSANIVGDMDEIDHAERTFTTRESCTYSGNCTKSVKVEKCSGGKCRKVFEDREGHYSDCPGSRSVDVREQTYRIAWAVSFLNPMNTTEAFAKYEGLSDAQSRELSRSYGTCY